VHPQPAAIGVDRPPTTTTVYDHRRQNFDKHSAYVFVASVTGG
jgi:hypothetical protein